MKQNKTYIFKAEWDATAIQLKVFAIDEDEAFMKAERLVKKMDGGAWMKALTLLSVR